MPHGSAQAPQTVAPPLPSRTAPPPPNMLGGQTPVDPRDQRAADQQFPDRTGQQPFGGQGYPPPAPTPQAYAAPAAPPASQQPYAPPAAPGRASAPAEGPGRTQPTRPGPYPPTGPVPPAGLLSPPGFGGSGSSGSRPAGVTGAARVLPEPQRALPEPPRSVPEPPRAVPEPQRVLPEPPRALPAPPIPDSPVPALPAAVRKGQRRLWVGLAAVLVVLVAATVGLVTFRPAGLFGSGTTATPSRSAVPAPPPSPVLGAAGSDAPVPSADAVAAALRVPLTDGRLGSHVAVQVVDVATGQQLFAQNEADPTTPASAMKLATATAVLALRGPSYQLTTRVVAGTNPGEVVIIGGGDPTLAINATGSYPGAARLDDLADQVKRALGGTVPTKVIVDSTLYTGSNLGPSWDPSDVDNGGQAARITALMTDGGRMNPTKVAPPSPRYPRPDIAAGQAFAKLLGVPASAVVSGTAPAGPADPVAASPGDPSATGSASALPPGTQLGAVKSAPLLNIVEQMLANSDNTVAEMMARQVALARNQPASFAGGAAAVVDELNELGLPTGGVHIVDGSGLSPDDKLTTRLLTAILALVAKSDHPQLHGVFTGLPVAGYSGTLAGRFRSPSANPADGEVRAKTGTLTGVHALVGYAPDARGRLLAFAILVDKSTAPLFPAEDAVDRVAAALTQVS